MENFSSFPPDEEQEFAVYEERMQSAVRSANRIGIVVAGILTVLVLAIIFGFWDPDLLKKEHEQFDQLNAGPSTPAAAPAAAPAPTPAAGQPAAAPAAGQPAAAPAAGQPAAAPAAGQPAAAPPAAAATAGQPAAAPPAAAPPAPAAAPPAAPPHK